MADITYMLPNYKDNPDIIRDLANFAESFTDLLLTTADKDEIFMELQDTTNRLQEYVDGVVGNNAIPILYQCGYGRKTPMFQISGINQTLSGIITVNIDDFVGKPITTTSDAYIGDYIDYKYNSETKYKILIASIKSSTEYTCLIVDEYYDFDSYRYNDTDIGYEFDVVTAEDINSIIADDGYIGYVLQIVDGIGNIYLGYKDTGVHWCKIGSFSLKMFSVYFAKKEKKYFMWDGIELSDFGHTFLPQTEMYTKAEVDERLEVVNTETGKREYTLQSGNNVIIDRTDPAHPVLNIQHFTGLPEQDAITSLTAVKNSSISGFDITLKTLGSGDGFKCQLPNSDFSALRIALEALTITVSALEQEVDTIKEDTYIDPDVVALYSPFFEE